MSHSRKSFAYVVRRDIGEPKLLVLESHDEPGLEVPKGGLEWGESFAEAALRELREESGITGARVLRELGLAWYGREEQRFLLVEAPDGLPETFDHTVTGQGVDQGFVYAFRWVPIDSELKRQLVQGCGACVDALMDAAGAS